MGHGWFCSPLQGTLDWGVILEGHREYDTHLVATTYVLWRFWPQGSKKIFYIIKLAKKLKNVRIINDTTFHMFLGSGNQMQQLFLWSEVNFCPKDHLKVIFGYIFGFSAFFGTFTESKLIFEDIFEFYMISSFKWG